MFTFTEHPNEGTRGPHSALDTGPGPQLILKPFKNDLFEKCEEYVQTIFTFKGLDVTGVKNGIT